MRHLIGRSSSETRVLKGSGDPRRAPKCCTRIAESHQTPQEPWIDAKAVRNFITSSSRDSLHTMAKEPRPAIFCAATGSGSFLPSDPPMWLLSLLFLDSPASTGPLPLWPPATQESYVCVEYIWILPLHRRSMFVWRTYGLFHHTGDPCLFGEYMGFPCGASSKEPTYQFRRLRDEGSIPSVGKIPWRRKWHPTLVFLPEDSPWTEEPGRLQSMESQRVGHN